MAVKQKSRRSRQHRKRTKAPGLMPGSLVLDPTWPKPRIRLLAFGPDQQFELEDASPAELQQQCGKWPVMWVCVEGLGDEALLQKLAEMFGLHALALEDVVTLTQRAKLDHYECGFFWVAPLPRPAEGLHFEQVSLFFGRNFAISFHEHDSSAFDTVRERIKKGQRLKIHTSEADYLAYALIDALIDQYFPALDAYDDRLYALEEQISSRPERNHSHEIHQIKSDLLALRRAVWPLRETVNLLLHEDSPLIHEQTKIYLRDAYDHTVQLMDLTESYRELAAGLMDLYVSMISNRLNEVMKVLTIIATIFIPLSFVAGLYGMNFNTAASPLNMPELNWYWGYPFALGLMAMIAGGLLTFFWRRGWLRSRSGE